MSGMPLPRGTVTFLFSDIEGSSELVRRLGNDAFAAVRADHRRLLLRVRIGLHTAEPHLSDDRYVGIGVHRASRICDAARGGQILVSNATAGIIEDAALDGVDLVDLGAHRLKGFRHEQRLFQVTVEGLPSDFDLPRTDDAGSPGIGTFLLADLAGSGSLILLLGDEGSEAFIVEYQLCVSAVVEANDGIVLERAGDNVLAVFASAGAAARAAVGVRDAVSALRPPEGELAVSITIHSGRWSGDPRRVTASTALRRLALLARVCEPGQLLVSQTTAGLLEGESGVPALRDLGERTIPRVDESARLHELV